MNEEGRPNHRSRKPNMERVLVEEHEGRLGFEIPARIAELLNVSAGDRLEMDVVDGRLVLAKSGTAYRSDKSNSNGNQI